MMPSPDDKPAGAGITLPNSAFLDELARAAPRGSRLWVSAFPGNPDLTDARNWHGQPYTGAQADLVDQWGERNTYYCVAALNATADGEIRRRKANFARLLTLTLDDVLLEDIQGQVTYFLETSPGKTQAGISLDETDPDAANPQLLELLMSAISASGHVKADPAGNNFIRYVRLPVGTNHKPRESGPFAHRLLRWNPNVRMSLADAAAVFGFDLDALRVLEAAPRKIEQSGSQDERLRLQIEAVLKGASLHDSLNGIAASLVVSGMSGGAIVNLLRALLHNSAAPRDDRWIARFSDIPRAVSSAQQKFAPVIDIRLQPCSTPAAAPAVLAPHLQNVPGALGMAAWWINQTARKPQPSFAVQAALALGSVICGRRYRTSNANWSMLYFLNVGQSGCGKEHAKRAIETLLESANLGHLIGSGRFASESGVVSALIEKPSNFSVLDEFGKMLQVASIGANFADRNTMKALMEIWARADGNSLPVSYSTVGMSSRQAEDLGKRRVRKPSLTLLAMSTPDTLFGGLTSAAVADGFLNRFLIVHADHGRQESVEIEDQEPPAELLEWMREAYAAPAQVQAGLVDVPHDLEPTPIDVPITADASQVFRAFERENLRRADELDAEGLSEMLMRRTEMAMRLALIISVSCKRREISGNDAQWACDYVRHHADHALGQIRERLSDGPFDKLLKEILRLVVRAGEKGMTERDLDQGSAVWRASPEKMRTDALGALVRREQIVLAVKKSESGRGRPRKAYFNSAITVVTTENRIVEDCCGLLPSRPDA